MEVLECWVLNASIQYSIAPLLRHSNIPAYRNCPNVGLRPQDG